MYDRNYTHEQPSRALPGLVMILLIGLTLAITAALSAPRNAAPAHSPLRAMPADHRWSSAQVSQLIALVEASEAAGLDPRDFGLAALRSEQELCAELWGTKGSRQLDVLARTTALALAEAYRRKSGGGRAHSDDLSRDLELALHDDRLREWLALHTSAGTAEGKL